MKLPVVSGLIASILCLPSLRRKEFVGITGYDETQAKKVHTRTCPSHWSAEITVFHT